MAPAGHVRGAVLISYIKDIDDLRVPLGELPTSHTHHLELRCMAETFVALGYRVDAIDYRNLAFVPDRPYAFFIDARRNMQRLAPYLNADCIRVMHLDTAHILYQNFAEAERLLDLQRRRGVTLQARRSERVNLGIENADCGMMLGNRFTFDTWRYAGKPIYRLFIPSLARFPTPGDKTFSECRRRFLWLGSYGLVHKGLDLVLEAFAAMGDAELIVCGAIDGEPDFVRAYRTELYETPNIRTIGWVDVTGPIFRELTRSSVGLIYPSCSEGQAGAVATCMHAGLIPVISRESGVDVQCGQGIVLDRCTVETVTAAVRDIMTRSPAELRGMAVATWTEARARHTAERYREDYRRIVERLANAGRTGDLPPCDFDGAAGDPTSPARLGATMHRKVAVR